MTVAFSIPCAWCGKPVIGQNRQMIFAKGMTASGTRKGIFHPHCGDALMSICETGLAPKAQGQKTEAPVAPKVAAKKEPVEAVAEPVAKPERRPSSWRLPPIAQRPEPKPVLPVKGQKGETKKRRFDIRKPEADPKPERPPVDRSRVLDLQSRGFRPNQIAAQLRAPYAEVNRIIEEAA